MEYWQREVGCVVCQTAFFLRIRCVKCRLHAGSGASVNWRRRSTISTNTPTITGSTTICFFRRQFSRRSSFQPTGRVVHRQNICAPDLFSINLERTNCVICRMDIHSNICYTCHCDSSLYVVNPIYLCFATISMTGKPTFCKRSHFILSKCNYSVP